MAEDLAPTHAKVIVEGPLCVLYDILVGRNRFDEIIFLLIFSKYILVGITSFGHGCGNTPGVYTEVADYIDWINQIISEYP